MASHWPLPTVLTLLSPREGRPTAKQRALRPLPRGGKSSDCSVGAEKSLCKTQLLSVLKCSANHEEQDGASLGLGRRWDLLPRPAHQRVVRDTPLSEEAPCPHELRASRLLSPHRPGSSPDIQTAEQIPVPSYPHCSFSAVLMVPAPGDASSVPAPVSTHPCCPLQPHKCHCALPLHVGRTNAQRAFSARMTDENLKPSMPKTKVCPPSPTTHHPNAPPGQIFAWAEKSWNHPGHKSC